MTLVSVIVPVFNGARFLREALGSVRRQTFANIELIVVDDGSTDGSVAIAEASGAMVLRQQRKGVASARNAGVAASRGHIVAFLDQDDVWLPAKLQMQVDSIASVPRHVSLTMQEFFLDDSIDAPPRWFRRPELIGVAHAGWAPSCLAASRDVFDDVGTFDERFAQTSDSEWVARAKAKAIPFEVVDALLVRRRLHGANDSGSPTAMRELLQVMHEAAAQRRSGRLSDS